MSARGSQRGGSQMGDPSPGAGGGQDPGRQKSEFKRDAFDIPDGINKRIDLPAEAYVMKGRYQAQFARRPGYNTTGDNIKVNLNQFRVTSLGNPDVWQFDVVLSPVPMARAIYKKAWDCKKVQEKLKEHRFPWIWDGHKLAWQVNIDLGEERGRAGEDKNKFLVTLRPVGKVRLESLKAYLTGKADFDNSVLECLSFLDHVLRQGPSSNMKLIKRTFFHPEAQTLQLNLVTEAIKGIYAAISLNDSFNSGGLGLGINVDVTNQTFWIGQPFEQLVRNFLNSPVEVKGSNPKKYTQSAAFKALRRLHGVRFRVTHRGKMEDNKEYKVKQFAWGSQYGEEGACAKQVRFDKKMQDGSTKSYTIEEYYRETYNAKLVYPYWPLIYTTRAGYFPFEVCEVDRFNPYPFKLDAEQTSEMIKFAVQRPRERKEEVMKSARLLDWAGDKYLQHFGIKVEHNMPIVNAKLIKNPTIEFGAKKMNNPGTSGRWDLRNTKFLKPNAMPLKSWAFVSVDRCVDKATLANFVKAFKQAYIGHGGVIASEPLLLDSPPQKDGSATIYDAFQQTGNHFKATPQIIFFVLKDKTAWIYERMKKSADCRLACVTQMVNSQHVRKAAPQYCSNVCLKVNAKLGGQTSRVSGPSFFKVPTMVIGVDVSHGMASQLVPSVAGLCVSMDRDAAVYNATVQTNAYRTEILTPENVNGMLGPLIKRWTELNKTVPQQVFYFRDGVSEGQFAHVLEYEFEEMKKVFKRETGVVPKFAVIVATKRHHIRIFPERGDKNGNPFPGTLVEHEVTHPYHYDFYLCSHSAIQGTARPVHYNVLHDDVNWKPDDLQRMIYHQCYQFCRSTTPISLHPAVYYAHLVCYRARCHENKAISEQVPRDIQHHFLPAPGPMAKRDPSTTTSDSDSNLKPPPLLEMGGDEARPDCKVTFRNTMWWV
ncbi:Piwi domain-containing protein [Podospora didyma]|uniref:Piwi domain-containing protein n=1 Tax=Podospora didyma TaxID=330526 RepID=A0AAE0NP86_9PEZI|nr:Piwi domain-containing protein [Podospora didyma]